MATHHNKTLQVLASKLGLGQEDKVIGKAAELERLLQTKSVAGSNMSDTCKIVICLDLAAGLFGADLDLKTAIKYSGLKPSSYNNTKKVVQNLLEVDGGRLSTSVLCAALQCTNVQDYAEKVLEEYRKMAKMEIDLNLPQYVCMAVYHACRINKVKVPKSKLVERSGLKPMQWSKLDADWSKQLEQFFAGAKKKRGRPAKKVDEGDNPESMDIDTHPLKKDTEPEIESYADWKRRMLELAYKELKELELNEAKRQDTKDTPRRSPRKTPQKYSPYKSPSKVKGVRLLFPIGL